MVGAAFRTEPVAFRRVEVAFRRVEVAFLVVVDRQLQTGRLGRCLCGDYLLEICDLKKTLK